jgi:catechol 1,2-dioxygenase
MLKGFPGQNPSAAGRCPEGGHREDRSGRWRACARATGRSRDGEPWPARRGGNSVEHARFSGSRPAGGPHPEPTEGHMIIERQEDVTPAVLAVMQRTADPRLREIMTSLVRHLHGFVREVRLTEAEFQAATAIVTELGQATTRTHNETVLMAGSLGVSTLVCLLNNGDQGATDTHQNLLGPFWRMNSPAVPNGGSIVRSDTPGPPLFVRGRIEDRAGRPIAGAEVDVWHSSPAGFYENQDPGQAEMNLRGKFTTDAEGWFWFRTVKMAGYPIPTDAVVGRLLRAQDRHPFRPAHLHVLAVKDGYKTLISQVYASDDPKLCTDVQFGVTRALIGDFQRHDEPHPTEPGLAVPWYSLEYTFAMEPGTATLPRPPIQ